MLGNDRLARAISDVAWGNFLLTLRSKAEGAGVGFVEVDAQGTSPDVFGVRSGCTQRPVPTLALLQLRLFPGSRRERGEEHPCSRSPGPDGASGA